MVMMLYDTDPRKTCSTVTRRTLPFIICTCFAKCDQCAMRAVRTAPMTPMSCIFFGRNDDDDDYNDNNDDDYNDYNDDSDNDDDRTG